VTTKNVLIFPSSNEPGLEVVQALAKSNKFRVIGGSSYAVTYDPSRPLLAHHLHCPALDDKDFRPRFVELIRTHAVDLVFPTVDSVVAELSTWGQRPAAFVTSNAESANLFVSKRRTYERLRDVLRVPHIHDADPKMYPVFAKPDRGSGSRGGMLVRSAEELRLARTAGLVVHEFLPGDEFTVDCVNDLDGELLFASPRSRGRVDRGISLGTARVLYPDLLVHVERISREVRIEGPWFAQFKLDDDGVPTLLEVNLRVAGSMTLTRLSGVNIPLLAAFMYLGHPIEVPAVLEGVVLNRFLRNIGEVADFDWVVWDLDDTIVRKDGKVDPDVVARLYDFVNQDKRQYLLTKRPDASELLRTLHLPEKIFTEVRTTQDKVIELGRLLEDHGVVPDRCVVVNDSFTERVAIEARHPKLRVVMPDGLDVLARERIS
jgi:hypothetical protein